MEDYRALAHWHYRAGRPIAVTRVLTAKFQVSSVKFQEWDSKPETGNLTLAGVLVETRPVLNCRLRNVALPGRYTRGDKGRMARRLNREVTTIARVIVVPRFRGIGVAEALVRHALATARTAYVEALSSMGRHQRFFEHAGMMRFDRPMPADSVRLLAALAREGLMAADLAGLRGHEVSGFLGRELVRFSRAGRGRTRISTRRHEDTKNFNTENAESTEGTETDNRDIGIQILEGKYVGGKTRRGGGDTTGGAAHAQRPFEPFFRGRRFARAAEHGTRVGDRRLVRAALEEARRRVLSWPAYYVWRRAGARVPLVAAAGDVGGMAEAFTVFMAAREKRAVVEALRGTHPDLGRALVAWAGEYQHEGAKTRRRPIGRLAFRGSARLGNINTKT